jgi:hypothetical protein
MRINVSPATLSLHSRQIQTSRKQKSIRAGLTSRASRSSFLRSEPFSSKAPTSSIRARTGGTNFGALAVRTRDVDSLNTDQSMAVMRIRQKFAVELFARSSAQQLHPVRQRLSICRNEQRLRWTFTPLGDLFVVYNHNLSTRDQRSGTHGLSVVSNQLPRESAVHFSLLRLRMLISTRW